MSESPDTENELLPVRLIINEPNSSTTFEYHGSIERRKASDLIDTFELAVEMFHYPANGPMQSHKVKADTLIGDLNHLVNPIATASLFDADRVQVVCPSPEASGQVARLLGERGIDYRRNGNDLIVDVA
jgi:hypothetical protein